MTNKEMIKAAIFDLNGIFLQSSKLSDRFEKDFGVPVAFADHGYDLRRNKIRPDSSFQYQKNKGMACSLTATRTSPGEPS